MTIKQLVLGAALTAAVTSQAHAGTVLFKEGNNGDQDTVGNTTDHTYQDVNFKSTSKYVNDEARSLILHWPRPGTTIRLYDSPSASEGDDWVEIKVKETARTIQINTFEENQSSPFADYSAIYHPCNGLDGKVSHMTLTPGDAYGDPAACLFETLSFDFGQFPDKGGLAYEFPESGANYRVWMFNMLSLPDGYKINFKVDHIRGAAADDHAEVEMTFDLAGNVQDVVYGMDIDGQKFGGVLDAFEDLPPAVRANKYAAIGEAAIQIGSALYNDILDFADSGGRAHFPNVIESMLNEIGMATIAAVEDCGEPPDFGPIPNVPQLDPDGSTLPDLPQLPPSDPTTPRTIPTDDELPTKRRL